MSSFGIAVLPIRGCVFSTHWKKKSIELPTKPGSSLRATIMRKAPILFVRVPNPEFCHIGERYGDLISEAIENLGLEFRDVEFVTEEEQRTRRKSNGSG